MTLVFLGFLYNLFYKRPRIWKLNVYLLKAELSSHSNTLLNVNFVHVGVLVLH